MVGGQTGGAEREGSEVEELSMRVESSLGGSLIEGVDSEAEQGISSNMHATSSVGLG